jgi:hypothetical protein
MMRAFPELSSLALTNFFIYLKADESTAFLKEVSVPMIFFPSKVKSPWIRLFP